MKLSDYFLMPGVRRMAVIFGVFLGVPAWLLFGWKLGVLTGAVVTLIASVLIPLRIYFADLPYAKIKQTIETPLLLDERVRFTVRDGTIGGFLLLTEKSMIFLSLERGDHRLELSRDEVCSVIRDEDMTIRIFLNNTKFIRVFSGGCEQICDILRDHGWRVSDREQ